MKTIMIAAALLGFTTTAALAQKKNCEKVKAMTTIQRTPAATTHQGRAIVFTPCYSYRHNNIVVTECPEAFSDNSGNVEYMTENVFLGYFPDKRIEVRDEYAVPANAPLAPQHNVICDKKVVAPADGNFATGNCTSW